MKSGERSAEDMQPAQLPAARAKENVNRILSQTTDCMFSAKRPLAVEAENDDFEMSPWAVAPVGTFIELCVAIIFGTLTFLESESITSYLLSIHSIPRH